jgi:predicted aspartyl protease
MAATRLGLMASLAFAAGTFPVVAGSALPVQYLGHLATIPVQVNGSGPYPFVVDTGAAVTVIGQKLARELKIPVVGSSDVASPMGAAVQADSLRIDSLSFGDAAVDGVPAVALPLETVFGPLTAPAGILAVASLRGYVVTLDFVGGSVLVRPGELPPADGAQVLDYDGTDVVPRVSITLGDESVACVIDTGAPGGISLPPRLAKILPLVSPPVVTGHGRTVDATFEIRTAQLAGTARIGSITLSNPTLSFPENAGQAHLGMEVLSRLSITIDCASSRIAFDRPEGAERRLLRAGGKRRYGIQLPGLDGDELLVLGVDAGQAAAEGGLKEGDRIVMMNGRPVPRLSTSERIAALRGSPLVLRVRRGDDEIELTLKLE